jgi:hypothetical protein
MWFSWAFLPFSPTSKEYCSIPNYNTDMYGALKVGPQDEGIENSH